MLIAYLVTLLAGVGLWVLWFDPWYERIELPEWAPPSNVLRWVWVLGLAMTGASTRLVVDGTAALTGLAVGLLWSQLAAALGWSAAFMKAQRARTGFYLICLLWTAVALAAAASVALQPLAGLLLLPWLGVITYVGAFNFFVWQLEQRT